MPDRCDEIIELMLNHKGYGYRQVDKDLLKAFVRYEYDSNRWAMIISPEDDILGWISWYCFDDDSLEQLKEHGLPGCFEKQIPLHQGNNLYLANAVVRENSSPNILRTLVRMARQANPKAITCSAFLWNRKSPVWRWSSFSLMFRSIHHGRR